MASVDNQVSNWLRGTHGVKVPLDWLNACIEWLQEEHQGSLTQPQLCKQVYEQWLFADLRELALSVLPTDLENVEKMELNQVYCLQIDSIVDVGASYYSQLQKVTGKENSNAEVSGAAPAQPFWEPKPKRMLMMQLTDGVTVVKGMEYRQIPALSTNVAAGVKVKIKGKVLCRRGVLMLQADNLVVMGGEVEALIQTNTQQKCLQNNLEANVDNPTKPESKELRQDAKKNQNTQSKKPVNSNIRQQPNNRVQQQAVQPKNNVAVKPPVVNRNEALDDLANAWDDDDIDFDDIMQHLDSPNMASSGGVVKTGTPPGGQGSAKRPAAPSGVNSHSPRPTSVKKENPQNIATNNFGQLRMQNNQITNTNLNRNSGGGKPLSASINQVNAPTTALSQRPNFVVNSYHGNGNNVSSTVTPISNQRTNNLQNAKITSFARPSSSINCDPPSRKPLTNTRNDSSFSEVKDIKPSMNVKVKTENFSVSQVSHKRKSEETKDEKLVKTLKCESKTELQAARPWVYLSHILPNPPPVCRVKAYIATVVGKLDVNKGSFWSLTVKINDGSAALDVDLSDQFLASLIGFSAQDYVAMKTRISAEPHLKPMIMNSINNCQKQIVELNAILELQFSPQSPRPVVLQSIQLSDIHFQQLTTVVVADA